MQHRNRTHRAQTLLAASVLAGSALLSACVSFGNYADTQVRGAAAIERSADGTPVLHVDSCGEPVSMIGISQFSQKPPLLDASRQEPVTTPITVRLAAQVPGWQVEQYRTLDSTMTGLIGTAVAPKQKKAVQQVSLRMSTFNALKPGEYYIGDEPSNDGGLNNGRVVAADTFHAEACRPT